MAKLIGSHLLLAVLVSGAWISGGNGGKVECPNCSSVSKDSNLTYTLVNDETRQCGQMSNRNLTCPSEIRSEAANFETALETLSDVSALLAVVVAPRTSRLRGGDTEAVRCSAKTFNVFNLGIDENVWTAGCADWPEGRGKKALSCFNYWTRTWCDLDGDAQTKDQFKYCCEHDGGMDFNTWMH